MHRILVALIFLLGFSISEGALAQTLVFPEVMLKDISIDVPVLNAGETSYVVLNTDTLLVESVGESKVISVSLSSADFTISDPAIQYNQPVVIPGWLAILPPLIAIALALIFKEVLSSLFIGIFVGAATYGFYTGGFKGIFTAFFTVIDTYILNAIVDYGHASVILFSVLIGSIVAVISKSGGMHGVVNYLVKYAKDRRSGMLTTYFLGIAIFFDDYANSLVVGNTMRPITDRLRISREKLAFIVDSTAAPIAAIAFITTWIGAELTYITDGLAKIEAQHGVEIGQSAYGVFMSSLSYSFYSIFMLVFMFILLYKQRDYGPMWEAEKRAMKEGVKAVTVADKELETFEPVNLEKVRAYNAILPIFVVIFGTFASLIITGLSASKLDLLAAGIEIPNGTWEMLGAESGESAGFFRKLGIVIGSADSYVALLWASLAGLTLAIVMSISQRIMSLKDVMDAVLAGVNTMMPAIAILILAWSLADVTSTLNTAEYIKTFFGNDFSHIWVIPALTFVLSAFIAFSTGSSWSTMALVYPLVIPLSFSLALADPSYSEMTIMYNTIASVLAGSVLGDHVSPISDTTILSSLASQCNHIEHVRTQIPYALTVGAVALLIGVIPTAMGLPTWISFLVGFALLFLIVKYVGKNNPIIENEIEEE